MLSRVALAAAVLVTTAACSGAPLGPGDDAPATEPDAVEATPQAIAAAVIAHHDQQVVAVAPLFRRDELRAGDLGVELAFDRPEGDNTHVRVVVTEGEPFGDEGGFCEANPDDCETVTVDGVEAHRVYEAGAPESDPGVVYAWAERDGAVVYAYAYGPFVDGEDDGGPSEEVTALADTLVATVTDPAVGFRTSEAYAEAGDDLPDDVWLDWYGQGNGSPRPDDYRDWR